MVGTGRPTRYPPFMYRAELLRCAHCRHPMNVVPVVNHSGDTVDVDVCPECRSVFLEYFDGEPTGLARALREAHPEDTATSEDQEESPPALDCPACTNPMTQMRYYEEGPYIARCGDCMGLSATPEELQRLAEYVPPPKRGPALAFFDWLQKAVGGATD